MPTPSARISSLTLESGRAVRPALTCLASRSGGLTKVVQIICSQLTGRARPIFGGVMRIAPGLCATILVLTPVFADNAKDRESNTDHRAPLSVNILGLRSNNGRVGCTIYANPKGFPTDSAAALQRQWCPISSKKSSCRFQSLVAGTYAVACFHDENSNGKLDSGLFGIPTEGVVVSNQAKGFMGPPKFDAAKFKFTGAPSQITLKMEY